VKTARSFPRSDAGFTLIEIVVSGALMAIILASAYMCLRACLAGQKVIEPRVELFQNARVAMALMAADLRSACPLSKDSEFVGMQRMLGEVQVGNIDFATHNYTPRRPREGDYCQVSYFVDRDRQTGKLCLWRRRNPTIGLDPFSGGSREQIATGVLGLQFEYFDGLDWYSTWGDTEKQRKQQFSQKQRSNLTGMPEAVRITLLLDPNPRAKKQESAEEAKPEPPLAFQTVARLNLAAAQRSSSSSSSSSSDNTDSGGQTAPGPGNSGGGN
jgi:type II secretion system protein J